MIVILHVVILSFKLRQWNDIVAHPLPEGISWLTLSIDLKTNKMMLLDVKLIWQQLLPN
jgi:hypothetical protein